ncbi:hypothetical protein AB8U03_03485 [Clostridium sp. Mt-5]|uniref:Flagellar hook-length control protein FliK n=1 Tax=Clostridium moutaii TaxID=3240932 RepID=A0ABV4BKF4_9CLOT
MNLAGIWNINSTYNVNNRKISTKLSFEIGEKFSARVVQLNKSTGEILLKLLDGWQFSGEIENFQNVLENQLIRLEVEGFENGKLKLRIVNPEQDHNNGDKDPISLFIKENDYNLSNEDYELIDKMVKRDIPLTKNNISNIKSTLDFINKIKQNPEEEDVFIQKYLLSKNISLNDQKGSSISTTLKNFFNQLKSMSRDDLLTFLENNMELSENNIKSFNSVFKNQGTIYNEIKNLGQLLPKQIVQQNKWENVQLQNKVEDVLNSLKDNNMDSTNKNGVNVNKNQSIMQQSGGNNGSVKMDTLKTMADNQKLYAEEDLNGAETLKGGEALKSGEVTLKGESSIKNKPIETGNETQIYKNISADNKQENMGKDHLGSILTSLVRDKIMPHISHGNSMIKQDDIEQIEKQIKAQIDIKTDDMKDIIKGILDQKNSGKGDTNENIVRILNNNINDFKIFNTISNSYYYMDLPINLNHKDYQCKLMIKDERKKGKKIDSTNVKIAASINTENMGVVDAYLAVNNHNMDIDIKCNKKWLDLLSREHKKILESLSDVGYNIDVKFHEKVEEMNISTCREFFEDNDIGILNTRV